MSGYNIASLGLMAETIGEEKTRALLATYSCHLNTDVERFLLQSALVFDRQGLAKTQLVFASYQGREVLAGYFAIANKTLFVRKTARLSKTLCKRLSKFAVPLDGVNGFMISAPLIAQLGKNFANGYNSLISGDELLKLACDSVRQVQSLLGGKVAYLECENKPCLLDFYQRNGFVPFDERTLDAEGRQIHQADRLVQMLRYF